MDKRAIIKRLGKTKGIAIAILFSCIALIFMASAASAQDDKKERGYNGRITIKELVSKFKRGEIVKGYIIDGDDIIKIIRTTRYAIQIANSIIEDGLDFQKLPKIPLDKIKLPRDWDKEKSNAFKEKGRTIHKVKNKIAIIDSAIQSKKKDVHSIQAKSTIFYNVVNFYRTTFSRGADFSMTTFSEGARFPEATFSGRAYFSEATFSEWADFSKATFSEEVDFSEAIFSGGADFSAATFSEEADFSEATFSEWAYFSKATFSGGTYFSGATFSERAGFSEATFSEWADFSAATFSGEVCFKGITFSRGADFSGATFSGEAVFSGTTFSKGARFSEATFSGRAYFSGATFSEGARFSGATFSGRARFSEATFSGEADFSWATFHELAYFKESKVNILVLNATLFTKYADFREMRIGKLTYKCVSPAIIKGRIDFRNSSISEMHFQDIIFENDVDFSDVKFGIPLKEGKTEGKLTTVFRYVTFESDAYFIRTELHSNTAFERIKFKGDANFTDIAFKDFKRGDAKKFSLSYLTFKHLLLSLDDLPDIQHWVRDDKDRIRSFVDAEEDNMAKPTGGENLQPLPKVLYSLEEVFHSQNNLNDANKAYYYRKIIELENTRLMKFEDTSKKITFWPRVWNEVEWYSWGLPCGYATSWKKIVFCCSLFYIFFVILYSTGGKLTKIYQEEEGEFRLRLFVLPIKYLFHESEGDFVPNEYVIDHKKGWGKFISALKFSMVIFFKIGYIDTKISGKILRIDAKYFVWAEWVIGYWLLTALVITLSNTLPIVHRLISGIF